MRRCSRTIHGARREALLSIAGRRDENAWDNRVVLQLTARQTQLKSVFRGMLGRGVTALTVDAVRVRDIKFTRTTR